MGSEGVPGGPDSSRRFWGVLGGFQALQTPQLKCNEAGTCNTTALALTVG